MSILFLEAGIPSFWILIIIFWVVRAIIGAYKKKNKSNTDEKEKSQPGKSIEDILKELENSVTGETEKPTYAEPMYAEPVELEPIPVLEKTIDDYRNQKHSDMAKHRITKEKLTDGKFDDVDDKLMHLEAFELDAHQPLDQAQLTVEDMRRAVILGAILNRPEY